MDFQFALIDAMRERGMTKAELAEALGVTRARVSQLFSSEANPTIKLAARALHAVGLKNEYCPVRTAEAHSGSACDDGDFIVGIVSESAWLGEIGVAIAAERKLDVDTVKWFAFQHHRERHTTWHRKEGEVANSNGREVMEAA
ncbi:hypothetical protein SS05631_c35670 [Sinorhizobium sp. CCBAU 05631]|nr:hypothetical protein SS05631_c35670 [Sinorhizobium sp. CCBAU 05631]